MLARFADRANSGFQIEKPHSFNTRFAVLLQPRYLLRDAPMVLRRARVPASPIAAA